MSAPLVSVIIPVYNRARYVARAVESVLHQNYKNVEVIVVDDGSTDGSVEALAPYAGKIRLFTQKNFGVSVARNVGIRAAQGEWIAFLDSDDWWKPGKLDLQMRMIEKYGVSMCFTRCVTDGGDLWRDIDQIVSIEKEPGVHYVSDAAPSVCQAKCHPYFQSLVMEKQLLELVGMFDESLSNADDTQLLFRLSFHSGFLYLDAPLVVIQIGTDNSLTYNLNPESAARRLNSYLRVQAEMYWRLVVQNPPRAVRSRHRLAYFTLRRAQLACATGDVLLARALARNVIVLAGDLRVRVAGVLVYMFPRLMRPACRKRFNIK